MIAYRTLENTPAATVHQAFIEAFSDYQLQVDMSFEGFSRMLTRRGYHSGLSLGAFDGQALVGFMLNGFRTWENKATCYDIVTGVFPVCRGQGVASAMFSQLRELLQAQGSQQYLLEVLRDNEDAYRLYRRQGFEVKREFACYQLKRADFQPPPRLSAELTDASPFSPPEDFLDYAPSWQNSAQSIAAAADSFAYVEARIDGRLAGYGVIDKETGDIPQLSVAKEYRGQGIGGSILAKLIQATAAETIRSVNVDTRCLSARCFLEKSGFIFLPGNMKCCCRWLETGQFCLQHSIFQISSYPYGRY